ESLSKIFLRTPPGRLISEEDTMNRYSLIPIMLFIVGIQPAALRADDAAPATPSPAAVLFQTKCFFCHGDGHGNPQRAVSLQIPPGKLDLTKSKAPPAELEQVLRNGRNK